MILLNNDAAHNADIMTADVRTIRMLRKQIAGISMALAAVTLGMPRATQADEDEHMDVVLVVENGQLVSGDIDLEDIPPTVNIGTRVFPGEFDAFFSVSDPGFNTLDSGGTPPATDLEFNILAHPDLTFNLTYWDGTSSVSFGSVPSGETLLISRQVGPGQFLEATADGTTSDVPGFVIDTTDSAGALHRHLDFFLLGVGIVDPANGIYLLTLQCTMPDALPAIAPADPLWVVFNNGLSETAHDQAADWVTANLAAPSIPPDLDGDGDVDGVDFLTFSNCFNGALSPPNPGCLNLDADLDGDGDVDGTDFLTFSNCFNGGLNPPGPACPY